MKFGLFFVGEYIGIVTVSALIVTLFVTLLAGFYVAIMRRTALRA